MRKINIIITISDIVINNLKVAPIPLADFNLYIKLKQRNRMLHNALKFLLKNPKYFSLFLQELKTLLYLRLDLDL